MQGIGEKITGVISAVIGLAILAVILSQRANSANVITTFFSGLSSLVSTAVSPITGTTAGTGLISPGTGSIVNAFAGGGTTANVTGLANLAGNLIGPASSGSSALGGDAFGGSGAAVDSAFGNAGLSGSGFASSAPAGFENASNFTTVGSDF